jgi:hypothetical protein
MNARVFIPIENVSLQQQNYPFEQWFDHIARAENGAWLLSNGRRAMTAASCLLTPASGDRVICVGNHEEIFITAIVQRQSTEPMTLGHVGQALQLHASHLNVVASQHVFIGAAGDCDIQSAQGNVSIRCCDFVTQVSATWIQSANHCIAKFGDWTTNVQHLIRTHGKRQLLTAEKEFKVDADVIHMG